MSVKLISVTQPLIEGISTAEDLIVYCARVSNPNNQLNTDTGSKLLDYCIKNAHWSVFETVDMTVEIKTSRAIAAQILRHRSFSFQEFSQRYSTASSVTDIQLRAANKSNRQSSTEPIDPMLVYKDESDPRFETHIRASEIVSQHIAQTMRIYSSLVEAGVAPECARGVLPLATETTLYMKGSIRSWIHYLQVRDDEHAQLEHQIIARKIKEIFKSTFPIVSKALYESKV